MAAWTQVVLRHRYPVLVFWLAVVVVGFLANGRLTPLLSNTFTVPGTESERVRTLLERHYGDRSDGSYTVVFRVRDGLDAALQARLQSAVARAARVVPTGKPTELRAGSRHVLYEDVVSTLKLADAKGYTDDLLRALGRPPGAAATYVTGPAAIQHDLDPIFARDLRKGSAIALGVALVVLVAVFGLSFAVTIPFVFALCSILGTLALVYLSAREMTIATYARNLVELIGVGIAVDYSLLVVYRFREELERGGPKDEAVVRTMATAGRAVVFSGATVAIGLALLLFIPLPFIRSIGLAGFLLPLVSMAAALTLQPVLLSLYGRRGTHRHRILASHRRPVDVERGFWARLARAIMRRPALFLAAGAALLVAVAVPVFALQLTPGSTFGIPRSPQSVQGFDLLRAAVGPGAISPTQVLVDSGAAGRVLAAPTQTAIGRLERSLRADPEVAAVFYAPFGRFVDPSGRYAQVVVAGRHDYGEEPAQHFVHRLRGVLIPRAGFPAGVHALAGGGPPLGVDFLARSYDAFPWLVAAVLGLTYLLLLRAFRSLLLPLKAVLLNLLSVAASYGALVVCFRWGVGRDLFGLYSISQVEGWIPIFLFAMLFGLSMDYEVFLVSRMRETWDEQPDNARAVAHGLERTGRIVTAAAIVMVAAFSGFVAGSIVGLQEFGFGLAVAIFLDATVVRAILVPALMAIMGRWNWWLPRRVARVVRVEPSPLPTLHAP